MQTLHISIYTLAFLIALALVFDFMNGFHDAANAIATVVSTGVLKPQIAVAMAATFNFIAILVFQLKVASTIGKGTIDPHVVDHYVVFGAIDRFGVPKWVENKLIKNDGIIPVGPQFPSPVDAHRGNFQ